MTQLSRPILDVIRGSWTPAPLYQEINALATSDATCITSGSNTYGDTFQVDLSGVALPGPGPQVLNIHLRNTDANLLNVNIALLQEGVMIACWTKQPPQMVNPSQLFTSYELELTAEQVASITDYTQLRLQVQAGDMPANCCQGVTLPNTLYATFSNATGACGCIDGISATLTQGSPLLWSGQPPGFGTICGTCCTVIQLRCINGIWNLSFPGPCNTSPTGYTPTGSCSPLSLSATVEVGGISCPEGTAVLTVTQ